MALRRGFSSICSVFPSLTSLAAVFPALKAGYIQQFSSLASLQSVANVPASSKLASLVAGLRPITTAAAEHCGPGPRESLEQVRSRIFGTHIGRVNFWFPMQPLVLIPLIVLVSYACC